jgi:hypothetical protein
MSIVAFAVAFVGWAPYCVTTTAVVASRIRSIAERPTVTQPPLTPREHRVKAMLLRARNPNSRAAQLHEIAADIKDLQARLAAKGPQCAAQRTLCDI